ncbi:MAG: TonB family protein [Emcibacteraceae bacterium]|nr:TonB family protein [Emcibacteraceae bacterium]
MYRIILIFSITLFAAPLIADEATDKAEFKRLYAEFNDLYANSENINPIIDVGKQLYILAPKAYGKNHSNTAVVTYNLAKLYNEKSNGRDHSLEVMASDLYKKYFKILKKNKTPINGEYIDHYMAFVTTSRRLNGVKLKDRYLNKLISMSTSNLISEVKRAETEHFVANQRFLRGNEKKALKLFTQSKERYIAAIGKNNLMVANAATSEALIYFNNKKYTEAQSTYLQAIEIYESLNPINENLLANAHKNLARLYVETDKYDLAAYHGEQVIKFADDPQEMFLPIVRVTPLYPGYARTYGINGFVVLEITIDTEGRTKNIIITYASSKTFEKSAIKAVEKFRYIPRLKDDKRIEVHNVNVQMSFNIGERKAFTMKAIK